MPAFLLWPLVAGAAGTATGFVIGSRASNLAVLGASAAGILYLLKKA